MGKRQQENQLTKDMYEAGAAFGSSSEPEPTAGISRLAPHELKKRRMVKAIDPSKKNRDGSENKKSSNPFAAVNLVSSHKQQDTKPKRFNFSAAARKAAVVASKSATSASTKSVAFGLSSSKKQPSSAKDSAMLTEVTKIRQRHVDLDNGILAQFQKGSLNSDWKPLLDQYLDYSFEMERWFYNTISSKDTATTKDDSAKKEEPKTTVTTPPQASKSVGFTFGTSTPAPASLATPAPAAGGTTRFAATPFAASTPAPSSGTTASTRVSTPFVFPSSAATTTPATPATPATFGSTTPATTPGTTDTAATTEDADGDNEPSLLASNADPDWEEQHSCKVAIYRYRDNKPAKFASGLLRLQKHKQDADNNKRMVLRNGVGKVQFNVKLSSDMTFKSSVKASKKTGGRIERVDFMGINFDSDDNKPEHFTMRADEKDKLSEHVTAMAK